MDSEIFGINTQLLMGQILLGLINGAFYALLSLGLSLIFGMLNMINFAHGAQYMLGAFVAWFLLENAGISYWGSLLLAPLIVGSLGWLLERFVLRRISTQDPIYGLLLTFGITLLFEGAIRHFYGVTGSPYPIPEIFEGAIDLGFMILPLYRAWVLFASLVTCVITFVVIEKTSLGAKLRAARENPALVSAFGINVSKMLGLTYAAGTALAALAGVMAAPLYQVRATMGSDMIILVFAVVVVGGMGSIAGSVMAGFGLGFIEGLTKVFFPEASNTSIFVIMALVLLFFPAGLRGNEESA